MAWVLEKLRE